MARRRTYKGPLQVIVAEWWPFGPYSDVRKERLACGHVINAPTDFTGTPTNAYRRRCWKCRKGMPVDQ